MLEINVKEARSRFSKLLDKVAQGQKILLTRRGVKIAYLIPPQDDRNLPSLKKFRHSVQIQGNGLSAAVIEGREEERY